MKLLKKVNALYVVQRLMVKDAYMELEEFIYT
jgi:hypothetical protein